MNKNLEWDENSQIEFNNWFHDNYGTYSFRSEAFYTDCEIGDIKTRQSILYDWISTAFLCGYECAMNNKQHETLVKIQKNVEETNELVEKIDEYLKMKFNSTLIVDDKTMDIQIEANDAKEAKILTKKQYENSRVIGVVEVREEVK